MNTHEIISQIRNTLVHSDDSRSLALGEARRHLCRFLSNLPREW
jgi:hypothetical protein